MLDLFLSAYLVWLTEKCNRISCDECYVLIFHREPIQLWRTCLLHWLPLRYWEFYSKLQMITKWGLAIPIGYQFFLGPMHFDRKIEQKNPAATLWWQKELKHKDTRAVTLPISIPQEFRQKFPPLASSHRVPVLLYFISGGYSTSFLNGSPPGEFFTFVTECFLAVFSIRPLS